MTLLIIARHGNTFGPRDTPTRVGARTDPPLVASGHEQARRIGQWLRDNDIIPDAVFSSKLKRTIETAQLALAQAGLERPIQSRAMFNEVDYGPDENKTEDAVIARIGEDAIRDWDDKAVVPPGWVFDPKECVANWKSFAADIAATGHACALVVTSNGIARFAPHVTGDFASFAENNKIKLSTGALGVLQFSGDRWTLLDWNLKPS